VSLEVLHGAFVPLRCFERGECAQVAAFAVCGILLARIQTVLSGFEPSNHLYRWMQMEAALSPWYAGPRVHPLCFVARRPSRDFASPALSLRAVSSLVPAPPCVQS
jgi:hypothetical protein